jgi:hypothetical protein
MLKSRLVPVFLLLLQTEKLRKVQDFLLPFHGQAVQNLRERFLNAHGNLMISVARARLTWQYSIIGIEIGR